MIQRSRAVSLMASLAALVLFATGCRQLLTPPPGCDAGDATCVPDVPTEAPSATFVPALPTDLSQAATSGRYLEIVANVAHPSAARELELLCGNRRLATWSLSGTGDSATVGAVVDLLPCWTGGDVNGVSAPFGVNLVVIDRLEARHAQPEVYVRLDLRIDEGLGEVGAGAWPFLLMSDRLDDGDYLLQTDQALARPPEVTVDGIGAEVVALPTGWRIRLPSLPGLDAYGVLRDREFTSQIEVRAQNLTGRTTRLEREILIQRDLRPAVMLPGTIDAPFVTRAAAPVATGEGLVAITEGATAWEDALQVLVRPNGEMEASEFPLDQELASRSRDCRKPYEDFTSGFCPIALNGEGQLLFRNAANGQLALQQLPISKPGTRLDARPSISISDPAPWSSEHQWGRVSTGLICAEGRTEDRSACPTGCSMPLRAPRVCIASDGTIEREGPTGPATLSAGLSSEGFGTGEVFVTRSYQPDGTMDPLPVIGFGAPGGLFRWFDGSELPGMVDRLVGAGQQLAILNPGVVPSYLASTVGPLKPYGFHQADPTVTPIDQPLFVDVSGRVILIGARSDGKVLLSRWAPGADAAEQSVAFTLGIPSGWKPSAERFEPDRSRSLPGGGAVLLISLTDDWGSDQAWLTLAIDANLQPLWSSFSQQWEPPHALPMRDGSMVWLLEWMADGTVARFMPAR